MVESLARGADSCFLANTMLMYLYRIVAPGCLCLALVCGCSQREAPAAANGRLDLRGVDLQDGDAVRLNGEWVYTPADHVPGYAVVPHAFADGIERAEYQLEVLLDPGQVGENLAVGISTMGTAYELRSGTKIIAASGTVGTSKQSTRPGFRPVVSAVPVQAFVERDKHVVLPLTLTVANFHWRRGGFDTPIHLGRREQLEKRQAYRFAGDLFFAGAVCIMGAYHLVLYVMRRSSALFWFGASCLFLSLRGLLSGERFLSLVFPVEWDWYITAELISIYAAWPLYVTYLGAIFPSLTHRSVVRTVQLFGAVLVAGSLVVPTRIFSWSVLPFEIAVIATAVYAVVVFARAWRRGFPGGGVVFAGFVIFFAAILNDILQERGWIQSIYIVQGGFFAFIFSQAYLLAQQYAAAFRRAERLSADLESKVIERTRELEQINAFAREINTSESLDDVLEQIFEYIEANFGIEATFLQFYSATDNELYYHGCSRSARLRPETVAMLQELRIPMDESGGFFAMTFHRRKPFYLSRTDMDIEHEYDRRVVRGMGVTSFLLVPLTVRDNVIALISFTSFVRRMQLTKKDIRSIAGFCEQVAGAIHGSSLLAQVQEQRRRTEHLLLNILPAEVAEELKQHGVAEPVYFEQVTVMFTDFKGFTHVSETLTPQQLVGELDRCFSYFDAVSERYGLEKLKTIGDSYMCAGGIPRPNDTHVVDTLLAALEIQAFMDQLRELKQQAGEPYWELRIGVHTGPLVAGVIGEKKFAYDVWGDTVNTASRMESSGVPGRVNVSGSVYQAVEHLFVFEHRGPINAKNKGAIDMYFLQGIRPELSRDGDGRTPNASFETLRARGRS